jgi:hypothetical protein
LALFEKETRYSTHLATTCYFQIKCHLMMWKPASFINFQINFQIFNFKYN